MARTKFSTGEHKDIFLYNTTVENLFINEFLPDAPGDCVKVFLFGLMYAQFNEDIDSRTMALTLGLTEKDVDNAWKYWESNGLVRIHGSRDADDYVIEFVRQIDLFYGKTIEETYPVPAEEDEPSANFTEGYADTEEAAEAIIERLINQQLRGIFEKYQETTGRTLSRREAAKLTDAIKVYNIEPDILDFAIDYCTDIDKYSVDYIFKVALRWKEEGCRDVAQVKVMLDRHSKRNEFYRQVFGALGWNRLPAPADREIMDRWVDTLGYTVAEVLDACKAAAGVREPNLRYVNKILENKRLEKGGVNTRVRTPEQNKTPVAAAETDNEKPDEAMVSRKVLRDYYEYLRQEEDRARKARLGEVRHRIPGMKEVLAAEASLNNKLLSMQPGESKDKRQQLREQRKNLEEEKRSLLIQNGYPEDYLERQYKCNICKDTGYTDDGRTCTCCKERAEEAYKWFQKTRKQ
ncbi:MAG: DnaD domain protein [Mogibacterium sp.]|nr:DnaD domain protein [Mogibacterium sp.]